MSSNQETSSTKICVMRTICACHSETVVGEGLHSQFLDNEPDTLLNRNNSKPKKNIMTPPSHVLLKMKQLSIILTMAMILLFNEYEGVRLKRSGKLFVGALPPNLMRHTFGDDTVRQVVTGNNEDSVFKTRSRSVRSSTTNFVELNTVPPLYMEVAENGNLVLECVASGMPAPDIEWYKDGLLITSNINVDTQENALLKSIIGRRRSSKRSGFGNKRNPLDLAGYITNGPQSMAITNSKLERSCVDSFDSGVYECVVKTGKKTVSVKSEVKVVESSRMMKIGGKRCDSSFPQAAPVKIEQWMKTYMQVMSSNVRLTCRSNNADSITWITPDGQEVHEGSSKRNARERDFLTDEIGSRFKVLRSGDLILYDLRFEDMGLYKCIAQNTMTGEEDSIETYLLPFAADH